MGCYNETVFALGARAEALSLRKLYKLAFDY